MAWQAAALHDVAVIRRQLSLCVLQCGGAPPPSHGSRETRSFVTFPTWTRRLALRRHHLTTYKRLRVPSYFASFGAGEATSFWKRGSFRSGSNIGSSRSSAGVSGM